MSIRTLAKGILGSLAGGRLARPLVRRLARKNVNVAYYHYVGEPAPHYRAFYSGCTVARFKEDLERLACVFDFAPLEEVIAESSPSTNGSRPTLAITFDDGLDLRGTGAMEVLEAFGIKATNFVITSCIDNRSMMWRHKLSAIEALAPEPTWRTQFALLAREAGFNPMDGASSLMDATRTWDARRKDDWASLLWEKCGLPPLADYLAKWKPYMGWDELRQWMAAGHSVGFHTHTHPYCSRLEHGDLQDELIGPAANLKRELRIGSLPMSYPFGDRLRPEFEHELFEKGAFSSCFGIGGFSRKGTQAEKLERAGMEASDVGWAVYSSSVCRRIPVLSGPS